MSVLTLKSFSVNQVIGGSTYTNTLIIPVNLNSGNEVTIVTSLVELYAMCNSFTDFNEYKLVQDILKLGYRCILFRVLDIKDYSAIKLVGDKNYYYYNPNKTYSKSEIKFPQMENYGSSGLVCSTVYDFSTVSKESINNLLFFYDYTSGLNEDDFYAYAYDKFHLERKYAYKCIPYIDIVFNGRVHTFYFSRHNYDNIFSYKTDVSSINIPHQVCTKFELFNSDTGRGIKGEELKEAFEAAVGDQVHLRLEEGIENPFDNPKYHYIDEGELKEDDLEQLETEIYPGGSGSTAPGKVGDSYDYIDNMDNASSFPEIVKAFAEAVINSELPFLYEISEDGLKVEFISNILRNDAFLTNLNVDNSGKSIAPRLDEVTYYVDVNKDYELMYSYYIDVPGLHIRSKVPSCIKDIKLKIHYSGVSDVVFEIARIDANGDNLYNETFVITNVKGSINEDNPEYGLINILNKSNLITVDSCDIDVFEVNISGEYLLGNLSEELGYATLIDYINKVKTIDYELDDFVDIVGIVDTHIYVNRKTWLEYNPDLSFDTYVNLISNYHRALSDFSKELDCIVFASDPPKLENNLIDIQRLAVFQPNILNTGEMRVVPSYLIMLGKLTTGNYNGNTNQVYLLEPNTKFANDIERNQYKNVCITEYIDYQYIVDDCYIRYNNLFVNMQYIVLNIFIYKYIIGYLTYNGIAHNDIDNDDLINSVMSKYGNGTLYSMTIDKKTVVDRKLTMEITLTYRELIYYSFKLFVNLQVNY